MATPKGRYVADEVLLFIEVGGIRKAMSDVFQLSNSEARSRNRNFCILPVEVFGKGPKTTVCGALK